MKQEGGAQSHGRVRRGAHLLRHHSVAWFRRMIGVVGDLELSVLAAGAAVIAGTWLFVILAGLVIGGGTQSLDERVMLSLRHADDLKVPIGPPWLLDAAMDMTAVGGGLILTSLSLVIAGYIALQKRWGALILLVLASSGGAVLNAALKAWVVRHRPTIVPALVPALSSSFPSGHAMSSAAIYLSLAVLLAGLTQSRRDRVYILAVALATTFLVGLSRIYLGVHYPSDVLAGWTAGVVWALVCWLAVRSAPTVLERLSRRERAASKR